MKTTVRPRYMLGGFYFRERGESFIFLKMSLFVYTFNTVYETASDIGQPIFASYARRVRMIQLITPAHKRREKLVPSCPFF